MGRGERHIRHKIEISLNLPLNLELLAPSLSPCAHPMVIDARLSTCISTYHTMALMFFADLLAIRSMQIYVVLIPRCGDYLSAKTARLTLPRHCRISLCMQK